MASRNDIDINRLINALLSGTATAKDVMKKYKLKPIQLVALLSGTPQGLERIAKSAESQYKQFERYNPNVQYSSQIAGDVPATNPALDKYKQYPEKYRKLIQDFAISVLRDPVAGAGAFSTGKDLSAAYGLQPEEYNTLIGQLTKDADQILSGEASRKAKEFAAFQKLRGGLFKKAGLTPSAPEGGAIRAGFSAATGSPELFDLIEKYRTATQMKTPDWLIQEGGMGAYYPKTKQLKPTKSQKRKAIDKYAGGAIDLLGNLLGKSL